MTLLLLVCGLALLWLAGRRRRPELRLLRPKVRGGDHRGDVLSTPLRLELIGTMLDAGLSVSACVLAVGRWESAHAEERSPLEEIGQRLATGLDWDLCWEPAGSGPRSPDRRGLEELKTALGFAVRTGAPAADLLRAQAVRLRRARHREAEKAAAALGVRLVVPLGLCSLPAFICLGVLPVLIGLVPGLW